MNVEKAMAKAVKSCQPDHPLSCAANLMWEHDIGCVPVTDPQGRAIAMITDRDICMACTMKHRAPQDIPVGEAMSRSFISVHPQDSLEKARDLMRQHQLRRLPVVDDRGKLMGMLSLSDMARMSGFGAKDTAILPESVAATLASVTTPRAQMRS